MEKTYTSLHNHTEFSNLKIIDSINRVPELLDYGYKLGLGGVAITDHDCVSGHLQALNYYNEHFDEEQKKKFKLILGNEIYLCREGLNAENHQKGERFYHLILLAKDDIGLRQIRQISARAWTRGYVKNIMRTPTYSSDLIEVIGDEPGHVICSTACLAGFCATQFKEGNYDMIDTHLEAMEELFGKDNFFIELQPSYSEDQIRYNNFMIDRYWGKYPFICTTDSHYLNADCREIHKIFLNSKSKGDREVDEFYGSAYMMSPQEIGEYFDAQTIEQDKIEAMFENTNKIAAMVNEYHLKRTSIIPKVPVEKPQELDEVFVKILEQYPAKTTHLQETYKNYDKYDIALLNLIAEPWKEKIAAKSNVEKYIEELDYEFEQTNAISKKLDQPMSSYFITMKKFIDIMWNEGDSIVGPGRGSSASSLVNYLLGITQIDPLAQPLPLPYWRFLHAERPGLPDIDCDSESTKRTRIFNRVQDYFRSIGGDLISVCTFGTEKTKSAINTAGAGLGLDDDVLSYITSMVPNERGNDLTLKQCYYGDDDHAPIKAFVEQMNQYPMLWKVASYIEGMITRLGCHASGVVALNEQPWEYGGVMKTSSGQLVSAYDLEEAEEMGWVKFDLLTVQALDKIRTCLNLLLEAGKIEWQGSLRATYNKYIHPDVIDYEDNGMWEALYRGEIPACFQFDTKVGGQAIQEIHPTSLAQLVAGNGLMRLMADEEGNLPLDIYCRHKNNIQLWYDEMYAAGLNDEEINVLHPYLDIVYGMAVSQECMMRMVMDPHISDFTVGEANMARKAVAKKKPKVMAQVKELFYNKGLERGTRECLLDYVWNKQILPQAGYSFSDIHAVAYSYIAVQEMNLCYFYPSIYWKCACLSVDAGAVNEEDYYSLVDEGILELTDDEDKRDQNKIQYGKMASAIIKAKDYLTIQLPDINVARFGFWPDEKHNTITYGLKGIARIGDNIIQEIILNRPYKSLQHFLDKINRGAKKVISKDKVVNLIKAGCFDTIEKKPREQILKDYVRSVADQKKKLNLQNFAGLIKYKLLPQELDESIKIYNFTKYIRKMKAANNYILDEVAYDFYKEKYDLSKIEEINWNGMPTKVIAVSYWDKIYDSAMNLPRNYIKAHQYELLNQLNNVLFEEEYKKYGEGDILKWELESLSFYYSGHPLSHTVLPIQVSRLSDLRENEIEGFWTIKGKQVPRYRLHTIIGAVIDKDKTKGLVTLSTPDGVIDVKVFKQQFARYARTISEVDENGNKDVLEDSFFDKGTFLAVTGVMRGSVFCPKTYKSTGYDAILKIVVDENGNLKEFLRKAE